MVLISAGAWAVWSYEANRRMDATIADLRAKGRVLRWADMKYDDVADEENAATYLRAAWAAGVPATVASYKRPTVGTRAWQTLAQAEVAANGPALALTRKARPFDRVCWARPVPGATFPPIPQFPNVSSFCRVLQSAALLHHQQGREKQAIECWRDIEHTQRMIGAGRSNTLFAGLICMSESGIGTDAMLRIAPELRFGGNAGLDPADARSLIRELLDTDPMKHTVALGWQFEGIGATNAMLTSNTQTRPWLVWPGHVMQINRFAASMEQCAYDCEHLRYSPVQSPPEPTRNPFDCLTPQFTNVASDVIQEILRRRMAAMMVAVALHRHETGRLPTSMGELVSQYLPYIPMDPRNEDKTPLGYVLAEVGRRPLVYSAGNATAPVGQPPKTRADTIGNPIPQTGIFWQDVAAPAQ